MKHTYAWVAGDERRENPEEWTLYLKRFKIFYINAAREQGREECKANANEQKKAKIAKKRLIEFLC